MDVDINQSALEAVATAARREALEDVASRVNISCQAECPVDTGNLRRSHKVNGPDERAEEAEVEATADYAIYVHEGHRIVAWGHNTGRYQPANPWMRRGVDRESR